MGCCPMPINRQHKKQAIKSRRQIKNPEDMVSVRVSKQLPSMQGNANKEMNDSQQIVQIQIDSSLMMEDIGGFRDAVQQMKVHQMRLVAQIKQQIQKLHPQKMSTLYIQLCNKKFDQCDKAYKKLKIQLNKQPGDRSQSAIQQVALMYRNYLYDIIWIADYLNIGKSARKQMKQILSKFKVK